MDSDHKFTDMVKEFQISSIIELLDSFGESTLYRLPTATFFFVFIVFILFLFAAN